MNSMTEPHADRTEQPILSEKDTYTPKRVHWPSLLAVAIVVAAAAGGMFVTAQQEAKQAGGSPDRSSQSASPQAGTSNTPQRDDTKLAQKPH